MALFQRKRQAKRLPLHEWPVDRILEHISACFVGDRDRPHVRAAVVLHQNPALLPQDTEAEARREVEAAGEPWGGFHQWVVFLLDFSDDDRSGLFLDHDVSCLVRGFTTAPSQDEAIAAAQDWIEESGDEPEQTGFAWIPGIYQAATVAYVKGTQPEADMTWFGWVTPATNGLHPLREYPPKLHDGDSDSSDVEVGWILMPDHAIASMYADRGW